MSASTSCGEFAAGSWMVKRLALLFWTVRGFQPGGRLDASDVSGLVSPALSTAGLAAAAAAIAMALVLPVAYLTTRHRSRLGGAVNAGGLLLVRATASELVRLCQAH